MQDTTDKTRPDTRIRNLVSAAVLILFGIFVVVESLGYTLGTFARMGPGLLPLILGGLTILAGILVALTRDDEGDAPPIVARPAISVLAAMLVFALLIERAGLLPATAALVFISSFADPEHTLKSASALFGVLLVLVWGIFVLALGIPFQIIRGVL